MVWKLLLETMGKFVLTTLMFSALSRTVIRTPRLMPTVVLGYRLLLSSAALKTRTRLPTHSKNAKRLPSWESCMENAFAMELPSRRKLR